MSSPTELSSFRYGVFIEPAEPLGSVAAAATELARERGFTAAAAYAPHVTLLGSIALNDAVDESTLIDRVGGLAASTPALKLTNRGLSPYSAASVVYDIGSDDRGDRHPVMTNLVARLYESLADIRQFPESDWGNSSRKRSGPGNHRGHLSVISHDGIDRPDDVAQFIADARRQGLDGPGTDPGETLAIHRLKSTNWSGEYWHSMNWTVIARWHLPTR